MLQVYFFVCVVCVVSVIDVVSVVSVVSIVSVVSVENKHLNNYFQIKAVSAGLEPTTPELTALCTTYCATKPYH